jgi:hypothetical protein
VPQLDDLSPWIGFTSLDVPPLPSSTWVAHSQVSVDGGVLRFREEWDGQHVPLPSVQAGRKMLEGFVSLWRGDDEEIRAYAATWGPFGFCEHGLPRRHPSLPWAQFPLERDFNCLSEQFETLVPEEGASSIQMIERLHDWRTWSRMAQAVLAVSGSLWRDQRPDPTDAELVRGWVFETLMHKKRPVVLPSPWIALQEALYLWLNWSGVRLAMTPTGVAPRVRPTLELVLPNLGAGLGLWLAANVCRADNIAFCAGCSAPFPTTRRLREGQSRQYCKNCRGANVPQADALRDFLVKHPDYYQGRRKKRVASTDAGP